MDNVFITQTSHFFPNEPVPNDEMEDYLGLINNHKSLSRPIVLRNNGIKTRYYALDKKGNMTHSSIQMAANSIRGLVPLLLNSLCLRLLLWCTENCQNLEI